MRIIIFDLSSNSPQECARNFGARNIKGSGLTSGDNTEHLWADTRPLNKTLKYMSAANARDTWQDVVRSARFWLQESSADGPVTAGQLLREDVRRDS